MIRLKKINKIYDNGVKALSDIDLSFDKVGLNFIIGKSGSGKSTLLNIIGCLDTFEAGNYYFLDKDISNYSLDELDKIRNYYFGFIFQDFLLVENMNVFENILFSIDLQNDKDYNKVYEIMKELDIYDLKDREISEISGGQRQRVSIARALVKKPSVILADEPTGNLDEISKKAIYDLLKKLSEDYLVIVVSHDLIAAQKYADRIIKIDESKIVDDRTNYIIKYDVIDSTNNEIIASNINKIDLINLIENDSESYSLSIEKKFEEKKENRGIEIKEINRIDNLPLKVILRYIKKSIFNNKLRYALSSIFYSLTFFLLFIFAFIINYQPDIVVDNYISKYKIETFATYKSVTYVDQFGASKYKDIQNGFSLKSKLSKKFENVYDVCETKLEINEQSGNVNCHFIDDNMYKLNANEIVVTDYLSFTYNLRKNDIINLFDISFSIKDIIETDYDTYDLNSKLADENHKKYASNKYKYEFNVCYVSKKTKDKLILFNDGMHLKASNFYYSNKNELYFNTGLTYNSIEKINSENLLFGRMPENNYEVLVSNSYVNSVINSDNIDFIINKEYIYKDLDDNCYNGFYSDTINLFKYFSDGIKIVGIVESENDDVYISNDIYENIIADYKDSLFADYFIVNGFKNAGVKFLLDNDIYIDDVNIQSIYDSAKFIHGISGYLFAILTIFIIISIFMILNHILTQIDKSKKQIGIMKALGVRNKDIVKLFIWEIMIVALFTIFMALIFYGVSLLIIDVKFINSILSNPFSIVYFDYISVLIVAISIILVFLLASMIPIIKLSNKKPMIVIREE